MKEGKSALFQEAFSSDEEDEGKEGGRSEIWEHTNLLTRYLHTLCITIIIIVIIIIMFLLT